MGLIMSLHETQKFKQALKRVEEQALFLQKEHKKMMAEIWEMVETIPPKCRRTFMNFYNIP